MAKSLSSTHSVLIIGASHAGISMAEQLRKNGFEGRITMLDREAGMPMERPPLSKAWLVEKPDADDPRFLMRQASWFEEFRIDFKPGAEVVSIDAPAQTARLADGAELGWDRLVLATGAIPRPLPIPGGDDPSVFVLRVPGDAARLSQALDDARRLAVVGGGYIGLEGAASARKRGLEVTVLEMAPRLLARVASAGASAFFHGLHQDHGTTIMTGASVTGISRYGDELHLVTDEGTVMADAVVAGIGVVPDLALADSIGVETGNGYKVNAQYETGHGGVFAIGDVALPDEGYMGGTMRIESVHHAQMSAEIAAAAMMGNPAKGHEVPWFWSDQYDRKLQSAGIVPAGAETVSRLGRREGATSFWSFLGDQLKAVEAINDPQAYTIGRMVIEAGLDLSPDQASDSGFDLKSLMRR